MYSRVPLRDENGIQEYADKDFYWGLIDRRQMQDFIQLARRVGYSAAREAFIFQVARPDKLHQYIDSFERADFHFMLPLDKNATILDLGSGYGNITLSLARHYRKVIAVDTSVELLEFVKLRAESEGLSNIEFVHADPFEYCNLPFSEHVFDAVIVSGVLEWVGAAKLEDSPRVYQERFLAQIRGFIKESGFLYLAIENRFFPGYLSRDPHSKLYFTALLPRPLANWYAKWRGLSDGYRTYIYGYVGYQLLLRKAGFTYTSFLFPFSGYRSPSVIWPNRQEAMFYLLGSDLGQKIYTRKWRLLIRICQMFQYAGLFLSSYMIIASPRKATLPLSIMRLAKSLSPLIQTDDFVVKSCDDADFADFVKFFLFHKGDIAPYAQVYAPRNPKEENGHMKSLRFVPYVR